jgi:hypothetical protein
MNQPPPKEDVSLKVKLGQDGFEGSLNLPADLPRSTGKGLAKAIQFGIAGAFPAFFDRASKNIGRAEIRKTLIAALSSSIADPSESGRIADLLATVLSDQELRQQKRSAILDFTVDHLRHSDPQVVANSENAVTDAFLNHFWTTADALSQDEMREVFDRTLAREIRSPGSFSASTLNLLTTLHPQIAMKFSLLCAMTFAFKGLVFVIVAMPHADGPNTIAHALGTSRKIGEQLTDFGLAREDLLDLRSAGLIRSLPEEEYPDLTAFFEASTVDFSGALVTFEVGPAARERAGLAIVTSTNVVSFTRAGAELRSILPLNPDPRYAEALKALKLGAGVRFSYVQPSD